MTVFVSKEDWIVLFHVKYIEQSKYCCLPIAKINECKRQNFTFHKFSLDFSAFTTGSSPFVSCVFVFICLFVQLCEPLKSVIVNILYA